MALTKWTERVQEKREQAKQAEQEKNQGENNPRQRQPIYTLINEGRIELSSHSRIFIEERLKQKCGFEQRKCKIETSYPDTRYRPTGATVRLAAQRVLDAHVSADGVEQAAITMLENNPPDPKSTCTYCLKTYAKNKPWQITCGSELCHRMHQAVLSAQWRAKNTEYLKNYHLRHKKQYFETHNVTLGTGTR